MSPNSCVGRSIILLLKFTVSNGHKSINQDQIHLQQPGKFRYKLGHSCVGRSIILLLKFTVSNGHKSINQDQIHLQQPGKFRYKLGLIFVINCFFKNYTVQCRRS
jgi:hypothetical protein